MWQSRGNENEKGDFSFEQCWLRHTGGEGGEERNWIIEGKLLYYLWLLGTAQLKSKPSENHSTKSISFLDSIPLFPRSPSTHSEPFEIASSSSCTNRTNVFVVLSMTDLLLILVHFPLAHSPTRRIQFDRKWKIYCVRFSFFCLRIQ